MTISSQPNTKLLPLSSHSRELLRRARQVARGQGDQVRRKHFLLGLTLMKGPVAVSLRKTLQREHSQLAGTSLLLMEAARIVTPSQPSRSSSSPRPSKKARKVLADASALAQEQGAECLDIDHILAGLGPEKLLAQAQFNLGLMYEGGKGVKQDDKQAVEWYRKSVLQGHETAKKNLDLIMNPPALKLADVIRVAKKRDGQLKTLDEALCRMGELAKMALSTSRFRTAWTSTSASPIPPRNRDDKEFQQLRDLILDFKGQEFNSVALFDGADIAVTVGDEGGTIDLAGIDLSKAFRAGGLNRFVNIRTEADAKKAASRINDVIGAVAHLRAKHQKMVKENPKLQE